MVHSPLIIILLHLTTYQPWQKHPQRRRQQPKRQLEPRPSPLGRAPKKRLLLLRAHWCPLRLASSDLVSLCLGFAVCCCLHCALRIFIQSAYLGFYYCAIEYAISLSFTAALYLNNDSYLIKTQYSKHVQVKYKNT